MYTYRLKYAADPAGTLTTSLERYLYENNNEDAFLAASKYLTGIKGNYILGSMELFTESGWKTVADPPVKIVASNLTTPPQPAKDPEDRMATSGRRVG